MYGTNKVAGLAAAALLVGAWSLPASAAIQVITGGTAYQNTNQTPCIIEGSSNCGSNQGVNYTDFPNQGNVTEVTDFESGQNTVQKIIDTVGNMFYVGWDVNDTNDPQTLTDFTMYVNGIATTQTVTDPPLPADFGSLQNGTGFADFLIGVFDLSGLALTDIVSFKVSMTGLNDGAEEFFLISAVPLPASLLLLLGGVAGLGFFGWKRETAA